MSTPNPHSPAAQQAHGEQSVEAQAWAHFALRVSRIYLAAAVVSIPLYLADALQTQAWQMWALVGVSLLVCGVAATSANLSRRGREVFGIRLLILATLVAGLAFSILIANAGLIAAVMVVWVPLLLATRALPAAEINRGFLATVYIGLLAVALNFLSPSTQLTSPALQTYLPAIAGVTLLAFAVFILRRFQSYALPTKVMLAFLVVTIIPMGALAFFNNRDTRQALTDVANQTLHAAAEQTATALDGFVDANLNVVRLESQLSLWSTYLSLPAAQRSASELETEVIHTLRILSRTGRIAVYIPSYALLDRQGRAVIDTNASDIGLDASAETYFQTPLQTRQAYVSPVLFPGTIGGAALYFSSPVLDTAGEIVGVLRVRYPAGVLQELALQRTGLAGAQSFAVVFDENYIHLAHGTAPDTLFKLAGPADAARIAELQAARRLPMRPSTADLSTNLPDLERKLANAAAQPLFAATDVATGHKVNQVAVAPLQKQPWLVAFFQPQEVFLALVQAQTRNTLLLGLVFAAVVAVAASGVARVLAGPITRLTAVAEKVSAGDLTVQARADSSDEIGRLAGAFNTMTAQLRGLIDSLELRVEERTGQLQASADVGRAAASILDPDRLLPEVVNLITDRFGFYYAAVFTLDEAGKFAVLREATGEAGQALKARGHQLEVGGRSMVGYATAQRKPRIALDVGQEAVRFANPLLPYTRSEIALPLVVGDRVLGALDVQSTQAAAFDEASAAVLQAMADQIAVALDNAALYSESQRNIDALNNLLAMSREIAGSRTFDDLKNRAMRYIETIVGTQNFYVALTDDQRTELRFVFRKRQGIEAEDIVTTRPFGYGRTEHVIRTRWPLRMSAAEAPARLAQLGLQASEEQPGAFLGVPILAGERVLGAIGLQDFAADASFSDHQERLTITLAHQMGVTLDNLRLAEETQRALADLDAANRHLTGEAWSRYAVATGVVSGEWRSGRWVRAEPDSQARDDAAHAQHPSQIMKIPVRVRGQTVGEFDVLRMADGHDWTPDDIAFAQALADQVGQTIETARLLEETERLAGRERLINDINSRVRQTVNMDSILKTAVNELGRSLGAVRVFARIGVPAERVAADNGNPTATLRVHPPRGEPEG